MREFVRDSIRQAHALCSEAHAAATGPEIAALARVQQERGRRIEAVDARIAATDRLLGANWSAMFRDFHERITRDAAELIRSRTLTLREEMRQSLERWFSIDESLDAICSSHWNKPLVDTGRGMFDGILGLVRRTASGSDAGLDIDAAIRSDMETAGFSPAAAGDAAMDSIAPVFDSAPYAAAIKPASVPVRKTLLDWLLFRSEARVQTRLFGEDGKQEITAREKERRLQEPSRAALNRHLEGIISDRFPVLPEKFAAAIAADYSSRTAAEITKRLRELRELLVRERTELQAPFTLDAGILAAATNIECRAASVRGDIELLAMQEDLPTSGGIQETPVGGEIGYIPDPPLVLPG